MTDRDAPAAAHERRPEQTRLDQRALQQPLRRGRRDAEAERLKPPPSRSMSAPAPNFLGESA